MIYLIKLAMLCVAEDQQDDVVIPVLKIGYSSDDRKKPRFDDYTNNGHCIRVLKSIPGGSIDLEHRIQAVFKKYRVPGRSIEWFYTEKEIIDVFDSCNSEEDLYNYLQRVEPKKSTKTQDFLLNWEEKLPELELTYSAESLCRVRNELSTFHVDLTTFPNKMKFLCEDVPVEDLELLGLFIPETFFNYYKEVGPSKIKALCYRNDEVKKEYESVLNKKKVPELIPEFFEVGSRYSYADTKKLLGEIYLIAGITKTPKATDIADFLEVKTCDMTNKLTGKREKGYRILSIKQ